MANKRKRDCSEEIEMYKKKIMELEKQQRQKRRRIIFSESSSESDHTPEVGEIRENNPVTSKEVSDLPPGVNNPSPITEVDPPPNTEPENIEVPAASQDQQIPNQEVGELPELDPELLLALGEETDNTPKYGEKIHQSLSRRWEPILKKGLPKDAKEMLFKEHLVPENCTLLQAPKLNVEVAAAVSETSRSRDKRKESDQQQLGIGISAISKAMTILLTSENKIEAIRLLSDDCRILTDLHHSETQSRISVINFALAKLFLNVVQDSERDETLYGNKLADKIKASKIIEKQGMQIKKYTKSQTATEQPSTSARPQQGLPARNQGNWFGPSRFQQNRGGRKVQRRPPPAAPSRRPPPPSQLTSSPAGQERPWGQAKPRAPRT